MPAPGWHDLFALTKRGAASMDGDLRPLLQNLQYFKDLLALPRGRAALMAPELEPMVGRYVRLEIEGVPHRLYFEEAGEGIPLVCLHTAGADNRQYRHLLADPEVTQRFRVLAFDMPWHGKSTPPDGWERGEYRLTTQSYTAAIRAFCTAHGARQAGRDGLLDRRPHRAQSRDRACRGVPRPDRARGRRLPAALVRHRLAAPARRAWRRGLRRAGLRPDRAAEPAGQPPRDAVDVHAGRARHLQRRSLLLSRRRRPAREGQGRSTPRSARSTC